MTADTSPGAKIRDCDFVSIVICHGQVDTWLHPTEKAPRSSEGLLSDICLREGGASIAARRAREGAVNNLILVLEVYSGEIGVPLCCKGTSFLFIVCREESRSTSPAVSLHRFFFGILESTRTAPKL